MTMSIAPLSAPPPTGGTRVRPATETSRTDPGSSLPSADAAGASTRSRDLRTNNVISFDDTGLTVVRTVDIATHEVVGQNPTEAYLRLAHAMIDTLRTEAGHERNADVKV